MALTREVLSGLRYSKEFEKRRIRLPYSVTGFLFDWLWILLYRLWGRYLKQRFRVDENCNRCSLCIKICPIKNIIIKENTIEFSKDCILCFRCVNQCPQEAIQIGRKTVGKFRWRGPYNCFHPLYLYYQNERK